MANNTPQRKKKKLQMERNILANKDIFKYPEEFRRKEQEQINANRERRLKKYGHI